MGAAALPGRILIFALLAALAGLGIGICLVLLPAFLPAFSYRLLSACYWGGGSLAVASGIAVDVTLLLLLMRFGRRRLAVALRS